MIVASSPLRTRCSDEVLIVDCYFSIACAQKAEGRRCQRNPLSSATQASSGEYTPFSELAEMEPFITTQTQVQERKTVSCEKMAWYNVVIHT
ncbi:hypothetical protein MTO96_046326 [Rhipicephalus appendiculatus]